MPDLFDIEPARARLEQALGGLPDVYAGAATPLAIVLGSGWGGVASCLQHAQRVSYAELPGFPQPGVAGHVGEAIVGRLGMRSVIALSGRKHGYESGAVNGMNAALRTLAAVGVETLVLTNAAGSLRPEVGAGELMLISDHLNLPQRSPLVDEAALPSSARFVDMNGAYDEVLRMQAREVADRHGIRLREGVYAWFFGPQFETPAEVRMADLLGADAVGMSTVPEVIMARALGLRVLGVSMITNLGAGLSDDTLSHAKTLQRAESASERACTLMAAVLEALK